MLKTYPTKPCRYCGNLGHWPYQCFKKPKPTKAKLYQAGKITKQWLLTRKAWFRKNPPEQYPYPHYICYLPGHGEWLRPPSYLAGLDNPLTEVVTLDHVLSRSRHPELRFTLSNLKPCCFDGNQEKGSHDGEV